MTLPAPRANPLILQRSEYERAPGWDAWSDFNVLWRGQRVGRIFLYEGARRLPDLHPPRKEYIHAIARQA